MATEGASVITTVRNFRIASAKRNQLANTRRGLVADEEVLVRTVFRKQHIDSEGKLIRNFFRPGPESSGFSVDRLSLTKSKELYESKLDDARYTPNFLMFVSAQASEVRKLEREEKRLFCVYDTGLGENKHHADICQNLYLSKNYPDRKSEMLKVAWALSTVFCEPSLKPQMSV